MASPIAEEVTRSPEFTAAAQALESCSATRFWRCASEQLADIGEAVAKINHDIRNVLSSATLVADICIGGPAGALRRAAYRSIAGTVVALVQSMMDYLAETPSAEPVRFVMKDLVSEIADSAKLDIAMRTAQFGWTGQ